MEPSNQPGEEKNGRERFFNQKRNVPNHRKLLEGKWEVKRQGEKRSKRGDRCSEGFVRNWRPSLIVPDRVIGATGRKKKGL